VTETETAAETEHFIARRDAKARSFFEWKLDIFWNTDWRKIRNF